MLSTVPCARITTPVSASGMSSVSFGWLAAPGRTTRTPVTFNVIAGKCLGKDLLDMPVRHSHQTLVLVIRQRDSALADLAAETSRGSALNLFDGKLFQV